MKGISLKKAIFLAGFITAMTFIRTVCAYAGGGSGVLLTAGAGSKLEMGIFDVVASNEIMGQASAGASTGIDEQALREGQIEETMAGYKNLGIAVVENHLNVREAPNEDSNLVGKMTRNAGCEILSVDDGWAHIKSGKVDGYVTLDYLLTGEEAKERARQVITLVAKVTTTTLFVREQPTTESSVVTMVPMDEELEVLEGEVNDPWVKIAIDEDQGYVSTEFVTLSEQLDKAVTMTELRYGMGVSDLRINLVNYAKQFLGNRYVWGGTSLTKGADCSGYVMQIYKKYNISLPRTSREQARCGTKIAGADAKPGDLFFYGKGGTVNHVAIYIGGGQIIHASNPRSGIKISNAYYRTPYAIRRVIKE